MPVRQDVTTSVIPAPHPHLLKRFKSAARHLAQLPRRCAGNQLLLQLCGCDVWGGFQHLGHHPCHERHGLRRPGSKPTSRLSLMSAGMWETAKG